MTPADLLTLIAWAAHVSGYPMPEHDPAFERVPHAFFVEHACGGKECNVLGWYNDAGTIYLDEKLTISQAGIVVHEGVHWLQHMSGLFDPKSCADSVRREREAYAVQDHYEVRTGSLPKPHGFMTCARA